MATYRFTPLTLWPNVSTPPPKRKASVSGDNSFDALRTRLTRELDILKASRIEVFTFHREEDLRSGDGLPKDSAPTPVHPGVILRFQSDALNRKLQFACDTFAEWTDNLQDIVMLLEQLRQVAGRASVPSPDLLYVPFTILPEEKREENKQRSQSGSSQSQYRDRSHTNNRGNNTGTRSAGNTGRSNAPRTPRSHIDAAAVLLEGAGEAVSKEHIQLLFTNAEVFSRVSALAIRQAHPDHGGSTERFQATFGARNLLRDVYHRT